MSRGTAGRGRTEAPVRTSPQTGEARRPYTPPPQGLREERDLLELIADLRPVSVEQGRLFADGPGGAMGGQPAQLCYLAGDPGTLAAPCVSVVGTREMTDAGASRARRLARELAAARVTVVSGLARGIDTAALSAALDAGGRTVAVIGTPLNRAYPAENGQLQERIYREHLLVSPFADGTAVQRHFFPLRNRVMAALSDATIIVEASDTSGTLHQAAECQRLGRWLFIARSVAADPSLKWPARFLGQPRTEVLSETADVLRRLDLP